ncbi:MAG: LysR family transcriptional regulator [Aliidongia sp.]
MDRFEAMSMFLTTLDKGSLSAAARAMRVPVPTLSRKVADLEALLGAQLLTRSTRKLTLTDAGIAYAAAARRILEQVHEAEQEAAGEFTTPRGDLVLAAPMLFGRLHVLPVVADFLALFPEINVRLMLGDRVVNLIDDHVDMAVRLGVLPDSGMIATRIGSMRAVMCGSPALLGKHGVPQTPEDLQRMPCVAADGSTLAPNWRFRHPDTAASFEVPVVPRLITTAEAAVAAAIRGIGFVRLRYYHAVDAIRAGKLVLVLEAYEPAPTPIHLIHVPRAQMPLKMRRFLAQDAAIPGFRRTESAQIPGRDRVFVLNGLTGAGAAAPRPGAAGPSPRTRPRRSRLRRAATLPQAPAARRGSSHARPVPGPAPAGPGRAAGPARS